MIPFELKVITAEGAEIIATWSGKDSLDACRRYADAHPGTSVYAWRFAERQGIFPGMPDNIID